MKGKILGAGAISAEDGGRYYYNEGEIKNLKDGQRLEGCEVDFDIKDGKAVMIYITKGSGFSVNLGGGLGGGANSASANLPKFDSPHIFWDLGEAVANLFKVNMHSAKLWFLVLAVLNIFTAFNLTPFILSGIKVGGVALNSAGIIQVASGFVVALFIIIVLVSLALAFLTSFQIGTLAQNYKLLLYTAIVVVASFVCMWLVQKIIEFYILSVAGAFWGGKVGTPTFKIIFAVIFALAIIVFSFTYLSLLSKITGERAFVWAFYAMIALAFISIIVIRATYNEKNPFETLDTMQICSVLTYCVSMAIAVWATLRFRKVESGVRISWF